MLGCVVSARDRSPTWPRSTGGGPHAFDGDPDRRPRRFQRRLAVGVLATLDVDDLGAGDDRVREDLAIVLARAWPGGLSLGPADRRDGAPALPGCASGRPRVAPRPDRLSSYGDTRSHLASVTGATSRLRHRSGMKNPIRTKCHANNLYRHECIR